MYRRNWFYLKDICEERNDFMVFLEYILLFIEDFFENDWKLVIDEIVDLE